LLRRAFFSLIEISWEPLGDYSLSDLLAFFGFPIDFWFLATSASSHCQLLGASLENRCRYAGCQIAALLTAT
jgi:hypothetical protein